MAHAFSIGIAGRRMTLVVFEAVEILVALPAHITLEGLFFFHPEGARIGREGLRIDDREGTVQVLVKLLVIVPMLRQISRYSMIRTWARRKAERTSAVEKLNPMRGKTQSKQCTRSFRSKAMNQNDDIDIKPTKIKSMPISHQLTDL